MRSSEGCEAVETLNRQAVRGERPLVLGCAEPLPHLIVMASAQIEGRGGQAVSAALEAFAVQARFVGDPHASVEPGRVVVVILAGKQAADAVNFADVGAA